MRALAWVDSLDKQGMTPAEVLVLYMLARRDRNPTCPGKVWPSIGRLSSDTGLSRRSIQRTIQKLVRRNLIQITGRAGGSSVYSLQQGGDILTQGGCQNDAGGATFCHPEVLKEGETEGEDLADAGEPPMKADDILDQMKKDPLDPEQLIDHYQSLTKPRQLGWFYRDVLALFHEDMKPTVPLTTRQERHLREMYGLAPKFHERIVYTLRHWIGFAKFSAEQAGVYSYPGSPSVEFLYRHRQSWITFTTTLSEDAPVQTFATPAAEPVSLEDDTYDPTKDPESTEYQPQTYEELMALIHDAD